MSLALSGAGVWAIAAGHLAGATARTIGRFAMAATRVEFRYERECAAALWRFGKHILFVNIIGAVLARADQIAVALFIGSSALGYYFIASRIPELVVGSLSVVLTLVLFPAFAKLNQDAARLKAAFLSATKFTALIAVPASVGLVALAPELVLVVFGRRWLPSAPMLGACHGIPDRGTRLECRRPVQGGRAPRAANAADLHRGGSGHPARLAICLVDHEIPRRWPWVT